MRQIASDTIGIPASFVRQHMNQHEFMRLLGVDEPEFFRMLLAGQIPPGCALSEFLDLPLIVWPRADVQSWLDDGRPANAELANRRERVIVALQRAIEAEYGCDIESLAANMVASSN